MLTYLHQLPDVTGQPCTGVFAQEFWHGSERHCTANARCAGVGDGSWHRIVLDHGSLFWCVEPEPSFPRSELDSEEYGRHSLVDVGTQYQLVELGGHSVSLHGELQLLVDAGLTPAEARAAAALFATTASCRASMRGLTIFDIGIIDNRE